MLEKLREGNNLGMYPCWVAYHDTWFDRRALVLEALIPVTAVADIQPGAFSGGGGRGVVGTTKE